MCHDSVLMLKGDVLTRSLKTVHACDLNPKASLGFPFYVLRAVHACDLNPKASLGFPFYVLRAVYALRFML